MLKLMVGEDEYYNEATEEFESGGGVEVELEHSLISLSKWESHYKKPFLSTDDKNSDELLYYVEMMVVSPLNPADLLTQLSENNMQEIQAYIESSESATTFGKMPKTPGRGEVITAELIYYWMVAFTIPFECEHWHLNRLFALIRVCNIKNAPPKKRSRAEAALERRELNEQRKKQYGTSG